MDLRKEFSKIYDQYIDKIYRFVFFKVNSQEVAEDLTSETFLRTWKVFQNGNPKIENIKAFLYQTARNLVIDYYREKGKFQVVTADNPFLTDPSENLEKKVLLKSEIEEIKTALTSLKEDYQNVIIWRYLDDLSIPEIAKLLGKTEENTRVLLSRALASLRKKITKEDSSLAE